MALPITTFNGVINLLQGLLQRGNNLDPGQGAIGAMVAPESLQDLTNTVEAQLVQLAQVELQQEFDWPCCESHEEFVYVPGGVPLPATVIRARAVYDQHLNSQTNRVERGREYWPSTIDGHEDLRLRHRDPVLNNRGGWGGGVNLVTGIDQGNGGECRRYWWTQENSLYIGKSAWHEDNDTPALWVDTQSYLAAYAMTNDQDWFTVNGPHVLALKAATLGSLIGWEDERLGAFNMELYGDPAHGRPGKLDALKSVAMKFRAGGTAQVARRPQPRYATPR
jgi:hypothetical protein